MQDEYLKRMVGNLPIVHVAAGFTQAQLGEKIGVSRQTIVAIENGKRPLPLSLYLAMVLVFMQNENSMKLMDSFNLYDIGFIRNAL